MSDGFWLGVLCGFSIPAIFAGLIVWRVNRAVDYAFKEGRDIAIDAAACKALDFGRDDIRDAINALVDGQRLHERLEYTERMKGVQA